MPASPYPQTRTVDVVEDHHGETVTDPYRWLEDTDSDETAGWVKAQNELTESVLARMPAREEIRARLRELWDYPKFGAPFQRGDRWFQNRNSGLQDQPVLHVWDAPATPDVTDATGRVLLDPNALSEDGTVAVTGLEVSDDGALLVYATSSAGSDWKTWRVRDVSTGEDLPDVVEWSKFCEASLRKDGSGFYYSAPEPPQPGREYLDQSRLQRVLFHRLGTDRAEDPIVYAEPQQPDWLPEATVTPSGDFVVISISRGTAPEAQLHVIDLSDPGTPARPLVPDFESTAEVVAVVGRTFYLLTDYGAERQRVVAVDLDAPARSQWREIIPEQQDRLRQVLHCGGRLVCHYLHDAHSVLRIHELDGGYVRDVELPGLASVDTIEGRHDRDLVHLSVSSYTESGALWSHDVATGQTELVRPSGCPIDAAAYVTEQVFVPSADGTRVPMFLTRRRDLSATGEVPVALYGYGGFDIPLTPAFSVSWAVWMERGGMLAVANLRGGGEYGRAWHDGGRLANKQNVFDDFAACARWLADSGWSRPARIGINGGSNGGLLVGASITQHPELFGAAVCEVGVLDMLRFHKFTIGWAWISDYGSPDDPEQYRWIRRYSPLHNIRPGTAYPPTLLLTGDHDDRVVPGHTFKFAATLQAAAEQAGRDGGEPAPVLVRVETSTGHGLGKPTSKIIDERADVLAFLERNLMEAPAG